MDPDLDRLLAAAAAEVLARDGNTLPEDRSKQVLASAGLAVPRSVVVDSADEAARADSLTAPLVVKALGATLVHKSDAGGVVLGVVDAAAAAHAIRQVDAGVRAAGHIPERFLVEEQAGRGVEIILGATRQPGGAWAVMIGLGGVWTEMLEDVGVGVAPLTRPEVHGIIDGLRGAGLLHGARGSAPVDVESLVAQIVRFAGVDGLLTRLPDWVEAVDVNPIVVTATGSTAVDASIVVGPPADSSGTARAEPVATDFSRLLEPKSVAVVGASARQPNLGNAFLDQLRAGEFGGRIVVVHPTAETVDGHVTVPSLRELDEPVDYAYITLPAPQVAPALTGADGRVGFAQVISSGFGEIEAGGEREAELSRIAVRERIRVLGPNCLGTFSPTGRISFVSDPPSEPGSVAFVSQSGGLSVDVIRLGAARGISFRAVVSLGNAIDVRPAELLDHFLADPDTAVVAFYLESIEAGLELLEMLRGRGPHKPVILLAGGRTSAGSTAASSHTGALAANEKVWPAIARQAGIVLVDDLGELLNCLEVFHFRDVRIAAGGGVVLFGNGGGTSVLASDALARAGLRVPLLPDDVLAGLAAIGLPPGNGLANPIDIPARSMIVDDGRVAKDILNVIHTGAKPGTVITHVNIGVIPATPDANGDDLVENVIRAVAAARDETGAGTPHLIVLRSDQRPITQGRAQHCAEVARGLGIPVFAEIPDAIAACRGLVAYHAATAYPADQERQRI
ncbi:acetate--CoA ligase family protein [Amycolatopsis alkalitolerans]|nr:acetate--CoA ligase family protein [Amycolatopsis alkalitolerans]